MVFFYEFYVVFDGLTFFFELCQECVRILCSDPKLLCCEDDGRRLYFRQSLDPAFHLGCAVRAVQPFYDVNALVSL